MTDVSASFNYQDGMNAGNLREVVRQLDEMGIEDRRPFTVKTLVTTNSTRHDPCYGIDVPNHPGWLKAEIERAKQRSEQVPERARPKVRSRRSDRS